MIEKRHHTTVSAKGQITIPKALRESLGIRPGTVLEVAAVRGNLIVQKREAEGPLLKWRGRGRLPGGGSVDAYWRASASRTTAVDTSVVLDVITDDALHANASVEALRRARREGRLIVCESVVTETRPALQSDAELTKMLHDLGIEFVPGSEAAAVLAGRHFARYLERGGAAGRGVPDFLIGAHAQVHADRLLARDRGNCATTSAS